MSVPPIGRADLDRLTASHRLVPITRTLFADGETPVGVYRKLAAGRPGTFLLESAEPGASFSRWSFVGVDAVASLSVRDGEAVWTGEVPAGVAIQGNPLEVLAAAWRSLRSPRLPGLPPLTGGFVGYLGYDVVRWIERLPEKAVDDLGLPELTMLLVSDLAAVDHHECTVTLIANVVLEPTMDSIDLDVRYADAERRLDAMQAALATPSPSTVATVQQVEPRPATSRSEPGEYQRAVAASIEAIRAGEVFQIVPGQRFSVATDAEPLDVYRVLRTLNPSPYMYYLHLADLDIVGSSPEALVTVHGRSATIHPIAGTRKRGETPERDAELVEEMINDPKERAEHVMLVDLARNDLGRVCTPGSVSVIEFGAVERYSNVSHIVSTVTGEVAAGVDAFDVFVSAFPHGTVTGAPKVRAMELIDELEPVRRGIYSGALGYLDPAGDIDMAICFRTAIMTGGIAHVQAGAGVVADSVPDLEDLETRNKARAVLQAIATAETPADRDVTSARRGHVEYAAALVLDLLAAGASLLVGGRTWQTVTTPRARPLSRRRAATRRPHDRLGVHRARPRRPGRGGRCARDPRPGPPSGRRGDRAVRDRSPLAGRRVVQRDRCLPRPAARRRPAQNGRRRRRGCPDRGAPALALLVLVCGVLVLLAGLLIAWRGHRWGAMSARYENRSTAEAAARVQADENPQKAAASLWTALDRGEDPTSR